MKRVNSAGLRPLYSKKSGDKFGGFVRACISLPFVPLSKLEDGVNIIRRLGRTLPTEREVDFASSMVRYLDSFWLNGRYPRETWNIFEHRGNRTNNHAEGEIKKDRLFTKTSMYFWENIFIGYNFRLISKKGVGKHPNPYTFSKMVMDELKLSANDGMAAQLGKPNKRRYLDKSLADLEKKRLEQMEKLLAGNIGLALYMRGMGSLSLALDKRTLITGW